MLATRTYEEIVDQVNSFVGGDLDSADTKRLNSLINFAAKRAYRRTLWWPRFLVTAEPRTVLRGRISYTEDSYHVYGAGTSDANGLYVRNGGNDGAPAYTLYDSDGSALYNIWYNVNSWFLTSTPIGDAVSITLFYAASTIELTPPEIGWAAFNPGEEPAPIVQALSDVDTFIYADRYDTFQDRVSQPFDIHPVGSDLVIHGKTIPEILYVTYRKRFTDTYGDGSAGTISDIPEEWFNYMALHAAYMLLQAQRQSNNNPYTGLAYREVESALDDALMQVEDQGMRSVYQRVSTQFTYDSTLI